MYHIGIIYYSGSGHTFKAASTLQKILNFQSDCQAVLFDVAQKDEFDWEFIHSCDAIVFGSPTYMGGVAGPYKVFMDQTADFWLEQKWKDKIAAAFTVGTAPSGDKLATLISLSLFAAQHGMIWVGQSQLGSRYDETTGDINENGSWLGLMAQSNPDKSKLLFERDLLSTEIFAGRIYSCVKRWGRVVSQES